MKRNAFTLLEVMIASSIFLVIAGIALSFSIAATKQVEMNTKNANTLSGLVFLMEKLQDELLQSSMTYTGLKEDRTTQITGEHIVIEPNAITFRKAVAFDMTLNLPVWSDWVRYELVPYHGEIEGNKLDDNGNGYVDEHALRRTVWGDIADINLKQPLENVLVTGQLYFPSPLYIAEVNQKAVNVSLPEPFPPFPLNCLPTPISPEPLAVIQPAMNMLNGFPDNTPNNPGGVIPDNLITIEMLYLDNDTIKRYRAVFTIQNL